MKVHRKANINSLMTRNLIKQPQTDWERTIELFIVSLYSNTIVKSTRHQCQNQNHQQDYFIKFKINSYTKQPNNIILEF